MSFFLFMLVFQTSPYTLSSSDERKRKKAKLSTKITVFFFVFLHNFLWLLMKDGQRTVEAELTGEREKSNLNTKTVTKTTLLIVQLNTEKQKGINKHNKTQKLLH